MYSTVLVQHDVAGLSMTTCVYVYNAGLRATFDPSFKTREIRCWWHNSSEMLLHGCPSRGKGALIPKRLNLAA